MTNINEEKLIALNNKILSYRILTKEILLELYKECEEFVSLRNYLEELLNTEAKEFINCRYIDGYIVDSVEVISKSDYKNLDVWNYVNWDTLVDSVVLAEYKLVDYDGYDGFYYKKDNKNV